MPGVATKMIAENGWAAVPLRRAGVVRAFAGDGDVVGVAFAPTRRGNAHEGRLLAELREIGRTDIAHRGTQAARELMQHAGHRTLVGYLPFDALWNQLQRVAHFGLEISVRRTACHGAHRAHAAIGFVGAALMQIDLARAL